MAKLKPCPFCGGEPYMAQNYLGQKYVNCPECGAVVWEKTRTIGEYLQLARKRQKKPPQTHGTGGLTMATVKLVDFDHVTDYIRREAAINAVQADGD